MFKTILLPTDGSPLSRKAEDAAIEMAQIGGSTLTVLAVAEPILGPYGSDSVFVDDPGIDPQELLAKAQARVQAVVHRAQAVGITCQSRVILSYYPYAEILRTAEEFGCDAIFMASHGRKGLQKLFLGSQTQKVLAHTTLPVLVFR